MSDLSTHSYSTMECKMCINTGCVALKSRITQVVHRCLAADFTVLASSYDCTLKNISCQSTHESSSKNKPPQCPSASSLTSVRGWKGVWGLWLRATPQNWPGQEIRLFVFILMWGFFFFFLHGANGWKSNSYECPAYFIIRCHTAAHLYKQQRYCTLLWSGRSCWKAPFTVHLACSERRIWLLCWIQTGSRSGRELQNCRTPDKTYLGPLRCWWKHFCDSGIRQSQTDFWKIKFN